VLVAALYTLFEAILISSPTRRSPVDETRAVVQPLAPPRPPRPFSVYAIYNVVKFTRVSVNFLPRTQRPMKLPRILYALYDVLLHARPGKTVPYIGRRQVVIAAAASVAHTCLCNAPSALSSGT